MNIVCPNCRLVVLYTFFNHFENARFTNRTATVDIPFTCYHCNHYFTAKIRYDFRSLEYVESNKEETEENN